ncbi:amino acid ABC transporter substrate-binding protein [Nitratireductor indicus]|uniref:amino acid ABC transporter substrate-binding protein n=1 Tax=Nitratireductor indicus TaxID=721133 RepID=UPI00287555C0|nr:amino acid ABC transporter substrate-binding protein [Nitratireductor indicus]MDS1135143.1 amino acid ABC transporter substrate-binding protein [Nitratireductor indicus]
MMNRRELAKTMLGAGIGLSLGMGTIAAHAEDAKPIRVGITVSNSGSFALASQSGERGVRIWVDDVNRRGGIELDGQKRPVELIALDDRSDKQMVPRVYETLINKEAVDVLIAPFGSTLTGAAASIAERSNKFMISWSASSDSIFDQGYKNLVSAVVPASMIPETNLKLMKELGIKKVAIAYVDEPFPASLAEAALKSAEEMGFEVVVNEKYHKGTKDFSVILQKAQALGAEAFYPLTYEVDSVLMVKQMKELDVSFNYIYMMYASTPQFLELGKDALYITSHTQYHPNVKWDITDGLQNDAFVARYKELFPSVSYPEDFQTVLAYGAGVVLERLIQSAQSMEPADLKKTALDLSNKITTLSGNFAIDESGKQTGMASIVLQNQPEKGLVPVAPSEVASEAVIYPIPKD